MALGFVNASRSYAFDESVTVGYFVMQDDLWSAVTSQGVFNNQPSITAIDWLIYHAGGTTEAWLRAPAIVAGGITVLLVGSWAGQRWGRATALSATLIVATSPLLLDVSRQVRGYSLATLAVAASAILTWRARDGREVSAWHWPMYSAIVALGLLSHLYVVIPVAAEGAYLLRHSRSLARSWTASAVAGGLIASVIYLQMLSSMLNAAAGRGGSFKSGFPADLAEALAGNTLLGAVAGCVLVVCLLRRPSLRPPAAVVLGAALLIWVVVHPFDLYPRFFVWIVPLAAIVVAVQAKGSQVATIIVIGYSLAMLPAIGDVLDRGSGIRASASVHAALVEAGHPTCAVGHFATSFRAYATVPWVNTTQGCDAYLVRKGDALGADVSPMKFAGIPGDPSTCVLAPPRVLRSIDGLLDHTCRS